jgi:hypothetical protein
MWPPPPARRQASLRGCTPTCTTSAAHGPTTAWRSPAPARPGKTCSPGTCSAAWPHSRPTPATPNSDSPSSARHASRSAPPRTRPRAHGWMPPRPSASPPTAATATPPRTRWPAPRRPSTPTGEPNPRPGHGCSRSTTRSWPGTGHWSRSGSPAPATRWPPSPSPCQPPSPRPSSAPSSCSKSRPPPARTARPGATATGSMSRSGSPARPSASARSTPPSASSTAPGASAASTPAPPPATSGNSMTSSARPCC